MAKQRLYPIGHEQDGHLLPSLVQHVEQAICPFSHYIHFSTHVKTDAHNATVNNYTTSAKHKIDNISD